MAYLKSRENPGKKPLMEKAAGWRCLFQGEKHPPVVYLQASSYQGLHLCLLLLLAAVTSEMLCR